MAYTTAAKVASLLSTVIDAGSTPSDTEVNEWINWAQSEIDSFFNVHFGQTNRTNILIDVHAYPTWKNPIIKLPYIPVLSISSVAENIAELNENANWQSRTEGPGSNTDFILLKRNFLGENLGYALYFYNNKPQPGLQRLKVSYTQGFNSTPRIVEELATYLAATAVLIAKLGIDISIQKMDLEGIAIQPAIPESWYAKIAELKDAIGRSLWGVALI